MGLLSCVVLLPKQAHGCFQQASSFYLSTTASHTLPTTRLEAACATAELLPPQSQLSETDDYYQLQVLTPGVHAKQLQVDVDPTARMVRVLAHKEVVGNSALELNDKTADSSSHVDVCYIHQWRIDESVHLPDLIMAYRNGVLVLSIPKHQEQDKPKDEITANSSSSIKSNGAPKAITQEKDGLRGEKTKKDVLTKHPKSFVKNAGKPRIRGATSSNGKTDATTTTVGSSNVPTSRQSVVEPHSIRGGSSQSPLADDAAEHVKSYLVVKQPGNGLLYRVAFEPAVSTSSTFSGDTVGTPNYGITGNVVFDQTSQDLLKQEINNNSNNNNMKYPRISQVSAEELEYWSNKL
jgi:HSP20 family molecular chaperone IbpA